MNGETVVLSQDHNRIMRAVKRKSRLWHGAFHLCGIILLAAALLWPLVSKQKLDLVTEAFRLVKAEIGLRSYNGGPSNRHNKSLDGYVKTVLARAEKYQKELE